ncbi:MAG: class I SAM-dependent methyltransferase [Rhodoblastus sp.]
MRAKKPNGAKNPRKRARRAYPFYVRKLLDFCDLLENGRLEMGLPDGRVFRFGGKAPGPQARMDIKNFAFARAFAHGDVGVAESYLRGEWTTPDLTVFLELFCVNHQATDRLLAGKPLVRFAQMAFHWLHRNTRAGARRNIHAHYDLGNAFYAKWLDVSMTYSSALDLNADGDLDGAQVRKYRALADALEARENQHILEIGCGWGGFAEHVARERGCKVTGLTISKEQLEFAQARIQKAGLSERVDLRMQDYRDERGHYDGVASIEMFEAVGEAYWPTFFAQVRDRLVGGGRAALQIITIDEAVFPRYRREMDFIRRYIFPGGMLPTRTILEKLGASHDLSLIAKRAFGQDYALTLAQWRDRFRAAWPDIAPLGFDEQFRRLWEYYLSYCEAGFRAGVIDVRHLVFARK